MKNMNALLALTLTLAACGSGTLLIEEDTWDTEVEDTDIEVEDTDVEDTDVEDTEDTDTEVEDTDCPDRVWYEDADQDGYANQDSRLVGCDRPGAEWVVEQNLKGYWSGETHLYWDCDDTNPNVYPGATEVCDGVDNNCNGFTDEEDPSLDEETLAWFGVDADEDGHWDGIKEPWLACPVDVPEGVVVIEKDFRGNFPKPDCDDEDPDTHPGAKDGLASDDGFNGKDNSCNGRPDNLWLRFIRGGVAELEVSGEFGSHTPGVMSTLEVIPLVGERHTFDFTHTTTEDWVRLVGVDSGDPAIVEEGVIILRSESHGVCYALGAVDAEGIQDEVSGCHPIFATFWWL